MLNENKIKMMTKMAIYEKNQGRQMLKNARYYKGDYRGKVYGKPLPGTPEKFVPGLEEKNERSGTSVSK